jgi:hypothetical protein
MKFHLEATMVYERENNCRDDLRKNTQNNQSRVGAKEGSTIERFEIPP